MERVRFKPGDMDYAEAGKQLAHRLMHENIGNAVVVGIPHAGALIASGVAKELGLPLEVIPCKDLSNPANNTKSIGSVSEHEMVLHDCPFDLPQDYIFSEITRLRGEISALTKFYYQSLPPARLQYRTVIIADDVLKSGDTLLACIKEVERQRPLKVIVVVPFVEADAARSLSSACDELVFLEMRKKMNSSERLYIRTPLADDNTIRQLLVDSKAKSIAALN
jgi:predicted phosphoribosyltransferase